MAGTPVPRPCDRVRPCPGRSTASRRQVPASSGAIADQFTAEPASPWTHTTAGPLAWPAEVEVVNRAVQLSPPRVRPHAQRPHVIAARA